MQPPLNLAKIIPPRFPQVLRRARLLERLEQQRDKKLVLILGQAAQGKSTLAFSYVTTATVPVAWMNLGPEDSEAVNLFYLLVQALQQALPENHLAPLLSYPTLPAGPREEIPLYRDWLLTLLNRIPTPVQVVFDGLDRLAPQAPAFSFLQVLLEVAPPHLHLLMLSREMPPLHLQELKIRQEVHLIRNAELAFTAKETRSYLQTVRRLLLPYDLVVQLHESTEGWVGGLVLLCETLEHLPAEAREKFISQGLNEDFREQVHAYFQESIFSSRPAKIQDFLVRSSILEVVEPDFIQEYLGLDQAREIMEELSAKNLFVQPIFDKQKGWLYRYHQLFKDFLQARFKEALPVDQQESAFRRAGDLWAARGDLESAVDCYVQAKAFPQAVAALEQAGLALLKQGKTAALARWLQNLPPALVQDHPWLLFYHYHTGRFTGAPEYFASLQRAHSLFQERQDLKGMLLTSAYLLDIATHISLPSFPWKTLLRQAEEVLQRADPWDFPAESGALWFQVGMAKMFGLEIRQGYQACRHAALLANQAGDHHLEIQALIYSRTILTAMGEFSAAQETGRQVEGLLAAWSFPELQVLQLLADGQLQMFRGEVEEAVTLVNMAREQAEKHGLTFLSPLAQFFHFLSLGYRGEYAAAVETGLNLLNHPFFSGSVLSGITSLHLAIFFYHTGDPAAAAEVAAKFRQVSDSDEVRGEYYLRILQLVEALIHYHRQEPLPDLEGELHQILREFTGIMSYLLIPEVHWILALWQWRQGRTEEAAAHLKAGLEAAAQRGSYFSIVLSPEDRGRIFTLALELEVEEVWDRLPSLLLSLAAQVGLDLARLAGHANPKIAARAGELRRAIHRQGLPRLDIRTLGGFRLHRDQKPINEAIWEGKQPKLLLKALVAHGGEVPKDVLLEALWPEGAPEVTEKNFRVSLHRLRKALEPDLDKDFGSSYIHLEDGLVSLDPELCRLDVTEFLALLGTGQNQEEEGNRKQAVALYKQALALYGGDFLAEELYLPWAERKREELRGLYLELLERLSRQYEEQGALRRAIDYGKKMVQADPLLEPAYRRLMILYARQGQRAEALRVYETCRQALARELDTEPDAVTTAIFRKIRDSA